MFTAGEKVFISRGFSIYDVGYYFEKFDTNKHKIVFNKDELKKNHIPKHWVGIKSTEIFKTKMDWMVIINNGLEGRHLILETLNEG